MHLLVAGCSGYARLFRGNFLDYDFDRTSGRLALRAKSLDRCGASVERLAASGMHVHLWGPRAYQKLKNLGRT